MTKKALTAKAQELIRDPKFLYRASQKISELGLVAKPENRLIIFIAGLSLTVTHKVSVLIAGDSSTGKSTLINTVLKLFAPESVIRRASFSRKAFAYGKESLDKKILYVNEYRGGRDAQLLLRILQSDGEIAHEYVTSGKTRVVLRLGSPVVFTTTTEEVIVPDDATRFLMIRLEPTPNQNLAVFKAAMATERNGYEPELDVWQESTRLIIGRYKKRFSYPNWFEYIADQVPKDKARFCRDWNRFLGCVEVIALCRSQVDGFEGISFADYCVAHRILNQAFTATAFDVTENELVVQRTVNRLSNELGRAVKIGEIRDALQWGEGMTYKHVRSSVKQKLIRYESGTEERNVKRLLPAEQRASTFLPAPQQVLQNAKGLPRSVEYVDPLTGEVLRVTRPSATKGAR
jgi:energy-coupling factor transporter ATP-binding protein EcfA2